MSALSSSSRV